MRLTGTCRCFLSSAREVRIAQAVRSRAKTSHGARETQHRRHGSSSLATSKDVSTSDLSENAIPAASTSVLAPTSDVKRRETFRGDLLYACSDEELEDYQIIEASDQTIGQFFKESLAPLQVAEDLAIRTMTHPLAAGPRQNHNGKLGALGKHVLRAHLALFVNLHRSALPDDIEVESTWLSEVLEQERLGKGPGEHLGVAGAMRYRLTNNVEGVFPRYTHRGQVVEALTGLVYRQFGAATSLRWFTSRILPHLAHPQEWHADVTTAAERDHDLSGSGSYLQELVQARKRRLLEIA